MSKPRADIPLEFRCPITFEIMEDPVEMDDGYTYEREAIEVWMSEHNNESPITNQKMSKKMKPNTQLKNRINDFFNHWGKNEKIHLIIKDLEGKSLFVEIKKNDTVKTLKNIIQEKINMPVMAQRLLNRSKQLNDDSKTMEDYCIGDNDVIHVLMRLRGGYL